MKQLLFFIGLIFLFSCTEKKRGAMQNTVDVSEKPIQEKLEPPKNSSVPTYNFSQLEPLLNKNTDTTYVINFWATWCKPCIMELPAFERLNKDYSDKKLKVLLVSLDFPEKLDSQVIPFIEKQNIKSEVILLDDADANSWIPKISTEWSGSIPATLIYNNKNRKFYERSFTYDSLEKEVKSLL